ncbi:hypothetical protein LDENG_00278800 [Lucifuga dentata]|nr:hypothetical protein LDENG_00278800 [Lucifuga dentata]
MFHYHSTGFPELDELMKTPQPLTFIMELLQVGDPMSYKRESWMMEKDEKLETVPILHMQGNALVKQRQFSEAASKYKEAVLLLKTVQSREMPGDTDYINLGLMIVPLELNYCQCMLELEEYYEVIEHTTELLEKHKDCVKGYYKRAKAHAAVWNEKEARKDFNMVTNLDVTLTSLVCRELKALLECMKEKYWEEKEAYWNMLENKESKYAEEEEESKEKESVTTVSKDESLQEKGDEESPSKVVGDHKEEHGGDKEEGVIKDALSEGIGNKEEKSCSGIQPDPNASSKTDRKDWQQMLRLVMFLQDEGNFLIKENQYEDASAKFKEAIEYVDFLQFKCMLELKQYSRVVELNNRLLKKHKGNFKAVYQRAQAHTALCNEDEARRDLVLVEKLDPKFKPFVRQELKKLGENIHSKHSRQKKTYLDATREKWGPDGSKAKAAAVKAGKKTVKFAQKATEEKTEANVKNDASKREEKESTKKPAPAETEGVDDKETERKNPDVKIEQCNEDTECGRASGEGLDNENKEIAAVQEDRQRAADKRERDIDSGPTPTTGKDNVVSKRSGSVKNRKKGQMPINCYSGSNRASQENKVMPDNTGNGDSQSESTSRCKLSAIKPKAAGEAKDRKRLEA